MYENSTHSIVSCHVVVDNYRRNLFILLAHRNIQIFVDISPFSLQACPAFPGYISFATAFVAFCTLIKCMVSPLALTFWLNPLSYCINVSSNAKFLQLCQLITEIPVIPVFHSEHCGHSIEPFHNFGLQFAQFIVNVATKTGLPKLSVVSTTSLLAFRGLFYFLLEFSTTCMGHNCYG